MKRRILIGIAILLVAVLLVIGVAMQIRSHKIKSLAKNPIYVPPGFTITAHTGCMKTVSNSVASMRTGVGYGADIVEFDVQVYNGEPVMSHNTPKGGEPSIKEAFDFLSGRETIKANVDLKTSEDISKIYEYAKNYNVENRIFFTGLDDVDIANVKEQCPGIPYYLNVSVDKSKKDDDEYIKGIVSKAKTFGAIGINVECRYASEKLTRTAQENGLLVSYWGADTEYKLYKTIQFSPDNITTKDPKLLKEILNKK